MSPPELGRVTRWLEHRRWDRWGRDGDLTRASIRVLIPGLWVGSIALALYATWVYTIGGGAPLAFDAHAYWLAGRRPHPYGLPPGEIDAVLYSPVFVLAMRVIALLPWPVFMALWIAGDAVAFWWLSAPVPWRWRVPLLAACVPSVLLGNVGALLCVCLVVALTRSAWWAAVPIVLTKITPMLVAVVWWLHHGERWRALGAAAVSAGLVLGSYAIEPELWTEWVVFLFAHSDDSVLRVARLVAGALVALWAARSGRPWLFGVAFYLLMPMASMVALMTLPRLMAVSSRMPAAAQAGTVSARFVTTRPAWSSRRRIGTVAAAPASAMMLIPSHAGELPWSSSQA